MRTKLLLFYIACVFFYSCNEFHPQSLAIEYNILNTNENECMFKVEAPMSAYVFASFGVWDISLSYDFWLHPFIKNNLQELTKSMNYQEGDLFGNPTTVFINAFKVKYDIGIFAELLEPAEKALFEGEETVITPSFIIKPEVQQAVSLIGIPRGKGIVLNRAVRRLLLSEWNKKSDLNFRDVDIKVTFYAEGVMYDGTVIKSNKFQYIIKTCYGCLINYKKKFYEECISAGTSDSSIPCNPGQDEIVDNNICYDYSISVTEFLFTAAKYPNLNKDLTDFFNNNKSMVDSICGSTIDSVQEWQKCWEWNMNRSLCCLGRLYWL
jgi:hypothetical protein